MQITASDAISTISARTSCVIRSGMIVGLSPTKMESFSSEKSSNPRQSQSGGDPNLGWCKAYPYQAKIMSEKAQLKMPAALYHQKGSREGISRVPRWLRAPLGIPLEIKLLGANLIILGVAVLVLFEPTRLQAARLTDVYIVVAALIIGAAVNFTVVRRPRPPHEH